MKLKTYRVVLSYNVQKTFIVDAKNSDKAFNKAFNWEGDTNKDNWEYRDHIETEQKIPHLKYITDLEEKK